MNETVKKSLKLTGKIALWALGVIVVLLLILPLWIGPVIKASSDSIPTRAVCMSAISSWRIRRTTRRRTASRSRRWTSTWR